MPSCCVSDILGNTPVYVARAALYTAVTDRLRGVDTPVRRRYPSCFPPGPGIEYRMRLIRSDAVDRAAPLGAAGCGWCAGRPTRDVTASEAAGAADAVARPATVSVGSSRSTRYMRALSISRDTAGHRHGPRNRPPTHAPATAREDVATGPPARTATATATPNRHAARPAPTPYEPRPAACPAVPSVAAVCRLPSSVAEMRSGWIAGCP